MMRPLFYISIALISLPCVGQEETDATFNAYAAGYKAAFTCSALFNGAKSPDHIVRDEFTGIYPLIADRLATLPSANVDEEAKTVSVEYTSAMPPRISHWRPHLGCVQLPVGADESSATLMPRIGDDLPEPDARSDSGAPWTVRAPVNGDSGNPALDEAVEGAFSAAFGKDAASSAILIATSDAILVERYKDGFSATTSQRTWSVAKSIAASVIGAAVQQDIIQVDQPADLAAWSKPADPRRTIQVQHLLHMASGLDSNRAGNRTDRLYMGGGLVADTAIPSALEATPGSRWKYANNDTLLAVRALHERLGGGHKALRFPFEALLYKIGMTHTKLETDWAGNFILSSQVWTTARDLARLGLLHLNDGVWEGERILPEGWVSFISKPAPAQPAERNGRGSAVPGYGAQWWLYNDRFPNIPNDAFAARGNRGQFLVIIPSKDLIIVRRGYDPAGGEGFQLHRFIEAVLAALTTTLSNTL